MVACGSRRSCRSTSCVSRCAIAVSLSHVLSRVEMLNAPPRWGQHWGHEWEQQQKRLGQMESKICSGASSAACVPAAIFRGSLSASGAAAERCTAQNYRYQPRDAVVQQHYQEQAVTRAPAPCTGNSKGQARVSSRRRGQARDTFRKARERRRSQGRGKGRKESARKVRNEIQRTQ